MSSWRKPGPIPRDLSMGRLDDVLRQTTARGNGPWLSPGRRWKSHRRAKHPGSELGAAEIKTLAFGRLAGGGFQHEVEDQLAAFLHTLLAVEDGAAIDVHVVFHALVHGC